MAYFQKIITKDDGFPEKPNPLSFEYLIDAYQLENGKTFAVGDRDLDIQAGRRAGIKTIYFNRKGRKREDADFSISHFEELEKILSLDS